jgi:RNA polymerase sigma-70 factor (ECF subfamily)
MLARHDAMSSDRLPATAETSAPADGVAAGSDASEYLDEAAFGRLHAETARPLWSYLYRVLGDAAQAEDLVQETFLRLLRARVAGLSEGERRAYAFRVAGNLAVDSWRRRRREGDVLESIERGTPPEQAPRERHLDVARSFDRLKPQERAMLWLAYVEGSAHEEIAQSLHLKTGSIRVLLFRARRRLRELLAGASGDSR